MKNRVALLTAVFPAIELYLPVLIDSLVNQTYKDFDWVIINDGVEESRLSGLINGRLNWINLEMKGEVPASNRWKGMKYCYDHDYEFVVFQDADDWMSENRIEDSIEQLSGSDIVFHDMSLVNKNGEIKYENIWAGRIKNGQAVEAGFIEDKNCIGLGNSAIRSSILEVDIDIPGKVIAADWFIFYHLIQERTAVFSANANIYYRQHDTNMAGIGLLTEDRVRKAFQVKSLHYEALVQHFPALQQEQKKLNWFAREVISKPEILSGYILKNKQKGISSFWWEETNYTI